MNSTVSPSVFPKVRGSGPAPGVTGNPQGHFGYSLPRLSCHTPARTLHDLKITLEGFDVFPVLIPSGKQKTFLEGAVLNM